MLSNWIALDTRGEKPISPPLPFFSAPSFLTHSLAFASSSPRRFQFDEGNSGTPFFSEVRWGGFNWALDKIALVTVDVWCVCACVCVKAREAEIFNTKIRGFHLIAQEKVGHRRSKKKGHSCKQATFFSNEVVVKLGKKSCGWRYGVNINFCLFGFLIIPCW